MSRSPDGKQLSCDAPGCTARIDAPVALQSAAADTGSPNTPQTRWLFVQRGGAWQHFCPSHSGTAFLNTDTGLSNAPPLPFRQLLLAVDSSAASRDAAASVAERLVGCDDACVTLLFSACARCTPASESEQELPLEAYCPGTRGAIARLTALFETRKIPIRLQIQSGPFSSERIAAAVTRTAYDAVVVPTPLQEAVLPQVRVPLLVLPAPSRA
jgi:hypothetical protein